MKETRINRTWHHDNRMPANATLEQRMQWHIKHSQNCKCRPVPQNVSEEIKKRSARV